MVGFAEVAALAETLAGTASRLKKRAVIEAALRAAREASTETNDAGLFALYVAGQPFAENDARKLNAGGALLSRAVLTVSGASEAALTAAYRRHGDLGAAAFDLLGGEGLGVRVQGSESLSLRDVAEVFAGMAVAKTTAVRAALVEGLLRRATPLGAKYLLKLMLGDMRIGVKQSLVEEAIAGAAGADVAAVRQAVMLEADLARVVERAFAGTLGEAKMTLFHPLGFMLASPVETPEEAVARFTEAPKKVVAPKKARKKRGVVEDLVAVDAAEEGLAEDVEAEAGRIAATPMSENPDPSASSGQAKGHPHRAATEYGGPSPAAQDDSERREAAQTGVAKPAPVLAFLEDKYDGMRAQVHCGDAEQPGRVAIYSRNREDITRSFPELEEAFSVVDEPLILDGEILGWEYASGQALPFAVLGQRIGRKVVSNALRTQIPVVFMAFDLLYEGGQLLLPLPLVERRVRLEEVAARWSERAVSPLVKAAIEKAQGELFGGDAESPSAAEAGIFGGRGMDGLKPIPYKAAAAEFKTAAEEVMVGPGEAGLSTALRSGRDDKFGGGAKERLLLSPTQRVADAAAIDRAYRDARARANEGVMLKAANSAYLPGRRGLAWVKLKRELATLDVVITGAEFGHGKRAGLLSDYTFAVRGEGGELLNVGKAYSGVTDAEIAELTEWLKAHTLEDRGHFRTVEPQIVLEVAFNNIMRSTRHASGFAMRFPRILRIRTDKPVGEIDTVERVEEIYMSQPDRPADAAE
jgi:DNA ligase 1